MTDEKSIQETNINEVVDISMNGKKNVIFELSTLVYYKNNRNQLTLENRLNLNKRISDTGCWIWTGSQMFDGRGQIRINNTSYLLPRLSLHLYKKFNLSDELNVLHKCNIPACWNPDHLYVGTQQDNMIDRYKNHIKKTHCPRNHEFTPENTRITNSGSKACKICNKEFSRKYRENKNGQ